MLKSVLVAGIGLGMASVAGAATVNLTYNNPPGDLAPQNVAANFSGVGPATWKIGTSVSTFLASYYAVTAGDSNFGAGNFRYVHDDTTTDLLTRVDIGAGEDGRSGALIFKFTTNPGLVFSGGTITISGSGFDGGGTGAGGLNVRVETGADLTLNPALTNGFAWVGSATDTQGRAYGGTPYADHTDSYALAIPTNVSSFYLAIEDNGVGVSGSTVNQDFYLGRNVAMDTSVQLSATVAAVPEPAVAGLLGLGVLALRRRRGA